MTDDNEKLLEVAYLEVLGRPVDEGGKKTHLNAMKTRSIDKVKKTLRCSPEYRDAYKAILDGKLGKEVAYIGGNGNIVWVRIGESSECNRVPISLIGLDPKSNSVTSSSSSSNPDISFVSTWDINCGIAIYTKDLFKSLIKLDKFNLDTKVYPLGSTGKIRGKIVHLQNEIGIMPQPLDVDSASNVLITWHTVLTDMGAKINEFESKLNVVGHIVTSSEAAKVISTWSVKPVYTINLGSTLIPRIKKNDARQLIKDIDIDKPIGFVFGLQSANKEYSELINASKNMGIHLIISGAKHDTGYQSKALQSSYSNVTFLDKYLSDLEVSLYALASDILLFDYKSQPHYSSSAAMHRLISAGRPVICSNIKHFSELTDMKNCLKFGNKKELEVCIKKALEPQMYDHLSNGALKYAEETSWENIANTPPHIYRKYVGGHFRHTDLNPTELREPLSQNEVEKMLEETTGEDVSCQ